VEALLGLALYAKPAEAAPISLDMFMEQTAEAFERAASSIKD
jgi:hypothetical protein